MTITYQSDTWIADLAQRQRPGWSLDQPFYANEDIFKADLEKIWMHYWVYVGHTSQLPRPGSYFTFQLGASRW